MSIDVVNCTIVHNAGFGFYNYDNGTPKSVKNTILYFNNFGAFDQVAGVVEVEYNCIQNWGGGGVGIINADPLLISGTQESCSVCELKTLPGSPCVDAGDPEAIYDDSCSPPSFGTARNDIGAHGGPMACLWDPWECAGASSYCSTGSNGAVMGLAMGSSVSVAANALVLEASPVPDTFGLFYFGDTQAQQLFGDCATRCIASNSSVRRLQPVALSMSGVASRFVDLTTDPGDDITPGTTWNFQLWFRDVGSCVSGFDMSDGLTVTFAP